MAFSRCPAPFLLESDFPAGHGDVDGRFCSSIAEGLPSCCLPCPAEEWFYSDNIRTLFKAVEGISIGSLVCCAVLLLSYAVLPVEYTSRHYLSICLVASIFVMTFASVLPLITKAPVCADLITPHDMQSSLSCAFSGATLIGGGFAVIMWGFLRSLTIHLQICWKFKPGNLFFVGAQITGWGIPIIFIAVPLSLTGLSYRFGEGCHLRSTNSLQTFWGPLLGIVSASLVLQFATLSYCIKVYIASLFDSSEDTGTTGTESVIPRTQASSVKTLTARQAFRRIKRVIALQWKGIVLIMIMLADVIFLATVFLQFNALSDDTSQEHVEKRKKWAICMVFSGGDKNSCLEEAAALVVPESVAMAVLFLLSVNGILCLFLLGRSEIITGWLELIRKKFGKAPEGDEFVSYNAARPDMPNRASFEMLSKGKTNYAEHVKQKEADLESLSSNNSRKSGKKDYEDGLYNSRAYRNQYPFGAGESRETLDHTKVDDDDSIKFHPLRAPNSPRSSPTYQHQRQQVIGFEIPPSPRDPNPDTTGPSRYVSAYGTQNDIGVALGSPHGDFDDNTPPFTGLRHPRVHSPRGRDRY